MAEDIRAKLGRYKTAPFDSRFPNQNQTRNCWQNYLDFQRCQRAMAARGADATSVPSVSPMSPMSPHCPLTVPDFQRCQRAMAARGADASPCQWYFRVYKSLCPTSWVTAWDEAREEGIFPGKI